MTFLDPQSLSINPQFVSSTNFHLASIAGSYKGDPFTAPGGGAVTADANISFCVDAGDPVAPYSNELPNNGGRINMGA